MDKMKKKRQPFFKKIGFEWKTVNKCLRADNAKHVT